MNSPKVFISYSWTPASNKEWVKNLAIKLRKDGVDVILDQWDLNVGDNEFEFMQSMVSDESISKVLLVCNRSYKEKADDFKSGVGKEAQIISPALYQSTRQSKFAAVVNEKTSDGDEFLPIYYKGRIYFDMSNSDFDSPEYQKLLNWAFDREGESSKPPIGIPPWLKQVDNKSDGESEKITLESSEEGSPNSLVRFFKIITDFGSSSGKGEADSRSKNDEDLLLVYDVTDLKSVLHGSEDVFQNFLKYLEDAEAGKRSQKDILNAINYGFNSRFVMYVRDDGLASSSTIHLGLTTEQIHKWFLEDLGDLLGYDKPISLNACPCNQRLTSKRPSLYIPLVTTNMNHGLFVYDPNFRHDDPTDDIKILTDALYMATDGFWSVKDIDRIKARVFDTFKSTYGHVSDSMYKSRFDLFKQELTALCLHFEPIIKFDSFHKTVSIWGVEALCRKLGGDAAPAEVFYAAELWGIRFQTEVDIQIMKMALAEYKSYSDSLGHDKRYPLSINVYPNTILKEGYRRSLMDELRKNKVNGENIILEISEKALIDSGDDERGDLDVFNRIQSELINTCGISFAMDDFGSGNSSISRVLKIKPKYVKVDRDILLDHEPDLAKQFIGLIGDLKERKRGVYAFDVIVEGLDEKTQLNISLTTLVNELKIKFIQGHLLSKSSPKISPSLDKDIESKIYSQLNW